MSKIKGAIFKNFLKYVDFFKESKDISVLDSKKNIQKKGNKKISKNIQKPAKKKKNGKGISAEFLAKIRPNKGKKNETKKGKEKRKDKSND